MLGWAFSQRHRVASIHYTQEVRYADSQKNPTAIAHRHRRA